MRLPPESCTTQGMFANSCIQWYIHTKILQPAQMGNENKKEHDAQASARTCMLMPEGPGGGMVGEGGLRDGARRQGGWLGLLELSDCVIWTNSCMYMYMRMYICKHLYNIYGLSDQWDASH